MLARVTLGALVLAVALAPAGVSAREQEPVPRMATAEAQLAYARARRGALARAAPAESDDARESARERAVAAYQAVRGFHPEARAPAVEAAFRAGELLRAAGADERARAEFAWAAEHGAGTDFRARARLELGHLERRAGRARGALEAYLAVAGEADARAARRDEAWLWAGVVWKTLGRTDEARAAWQRVAEQGADELVRIRAYDEMCALALERGDPEGAAGVLHECLVRLSARAEEETRAGARVRAALLRMRSVTELQRALARRRSPAVVGTPGKS